MTASCRQSALALEGPVTGAGIACGCERVRRLLEGGGRPVVVCDVAALTDPDLRTVDLLARLHLTARRLGREVRFCHASPELHALLVAVGLDGVVAVELGEPCRQSEEGEEPGGVEECVHRDDLPP